MRITVTVQHPDDEKRVVTERWENDAWKRGLGTTTLVPYRLPELLQAMERDDVILIVEGEKDCDTAVEHLGMTATCNPFGALKWKQEYSEHVAGARVVIIPDNDDIGHQHAHDVKAKLDKAGAACVVILDLRRLDPALPHKSDLTDYIDRGGSVRRLKDMVDHDLRVAMTNEDDDAGDNEVNVPSIDPDVLPDPLSMLVDGMDNPVKAWALLTASIVALGALMPTVRTLYGGRMVSPSLYFFVVGGPGTGKSIVEPARSLVLPVDRMLRQRSEAAMKAYRQAMEERTSAGNKGRVQHGLLDEPRMQTLLAPADSTGSRLVQLVCHNPSQLVFDTEADTLQIALRVDTGDASSLIRKAFHGEPVSVSRVKDNSDHSTDHPHLCMVLTGTPDQILTIVGHVRNGLLSRFCFIRFSDHVAYHSPFASTLERPFAAAAHVGERMRECWTFLQSLGSAGVTVELTQSQRDRFNEHMRPLVEDRISDYDLPTTLRSGLVKVRIAMILSVVRTWWETSRVPSTIVIDDRDFSTAMKLGDYLRQGTDAVINRLSSLNGPTILPRLKRQTLAWFTALPDTFTAQHAQQVGEQHGIGRTTVFKLLKAGQHFTRLKHGRYAKREQGPTV